MPSFHENTGPPKEGDSPCRRSGTSLRYTHSPQRTPTPYAHSGHALRLRPSPRAAVYITPRRPLRSALELANRVAVVWPEQILVDAIKLRCAIDKVHSVEVCVAAVRPIDDTIDVFADEMDATISE